MNQDEADIGPQRAVPSSINKIQAENKQTRAALDFILDRINKELKIPTRIEWFDLNKEKRKH